MNVIIEPFIVILHLSTSFIFLTHPLKRSTINSVSFKFQTITYSLLITKPLRNDFRAIVIDYMLKGCPRNILPHLLHFYSFTIHIREYIIETFINGLVVKTLTVFKMITFLFISIHLREYGLQIAMNVIIEPLTRVSRFEHIFTTSYVFHSYSSFYPYYTFLYF